MLLYLRALDDFFPLKLVFLTGDALTFTVQRFQYFGGKLETVAAIQNHSCYRYMDGMPAHKYYGYLVPTEEKFLSYLEVSLAKAVGGRFGKFERGSDNTIYRVVGDRQKDFIYYYSMDWTTKKGRGLLANMSALYLKGYFPPAPEEQALLASSLVNVETVISGREHPEAFEKPLRDRGVEFICDPAIYISESGWAQEWGVSRNRRDLASSVDYCIAQVWDRDYLIRRCGEIWEDLAFRVGKSSWVKSPAAAPGVAAERWDFLGAEQISEEEASMIIFGASES